MCGVAGLWCRQPAGGDRLRELVESMAESLTHRGPDDAGSFVDEPCGLALGHRRLSVVDLSPAGHQPMVSADGRFVLSYNGEVYNHRALRRELERAGVGLRGSSDTEVLVEWIARFGLDDALERANAMFALALWDRRERRLHLARDRFGEKPMFYGWAGESFVFGSELKALRRHPDLHPEVDRDVLALYLRHNCVPAPYCIYRGVAKLPPGSVLTVDGTTAPGQLPHPRRYWSMEQLVADATPVTGRAPEETLDALETVLGDAVSCRMDADVPVGAFLSGGIDSSLVVALMQARHSAKVKTFTIALADAAFDEAGDARAVADHLGTEHAELVVTPADALDAVASLPTWYDEPFADSSQIPTALLARLTRRHVTVALSGDGGDELFAGYNRYLWASRFWSRLGRLPRPVRVGAARALDAVSPAAWDALFERAGPVLPKALRVRMPGLKIAKVARVLPSSNLDEVHRLLASHVADPGALVIGATEPPTRLTEPGRWPDRLDPVARMMALDTVTYLPDDILTKVDRATMASSLEARVPFLDPAVAAFAWSLPLEDKLRAGEGKWVLRQLLYRHVPRALVDRPKMGFGIPVADWLRGPLRPWVDDLLAGERLRAEGYFDPGAVRALWSEHRSGRSDRHGELWDLCMFQAWIQAGGV